MFEYEIYCFEFDEQLYENIKCLVDFFCLATMELSPQHNILSHRYFLFVNSNALLNNNRQQTTILSLNAIISTQIIIYLKCIHSPDTS